MKKLHSEGVVKLTENGTTYRTAIGLLRSLFFLCIIWKGRWLSDGL